MKEVGFQVDPSLGVTGCLQNPVMLFEFFLLMVRETKQKMATSVHISAAL